MSHGYVVALLLDKVLIIVQKILMQFVRCRVILREPLVAPPGAQQSQLNQQNPQSLLGARNPPQAQTPPSQRS